jgi:hypothetical protein
MALGSPALADHTAPLDGTWGAAKGDVSAQVIISGGAVIGFFWRNDYLETTNAKLSADGAALSFAFRGGTAILTRTGEGAALLTIVDADETTSLPLKRD